MEHNITETVDSELCFDYMSDCAVFFFFVKVRQCVLAGAHLSMNSCCSVRGKKKPTGQQTPNQSAHS